MNFHIPTKVYFEDNVLDKNGHEIVKYGKKALIVTGKKSAEKSGVINDLLPVLEKHTIKYAVYSEIMENPDILIIEKGKEVLLSQNCDFIIAIGGGSPMDAGKAISIMGANNLSLDSLYDPSKHIIAFPIIAIPTTSGTGSEVTQYSVLNNHITNSKAGFGSELMFPKIAFLDAKYTLSLSKTVTRDTAIDALSHLLEGLYSNKYNEYLLPFIYKGIALIYNTLSKSLDDLDDLFYRKSLMLAANYGGIVIAHTSTTLQHSIGYPLTTVYGLSHGLANGVVMKEIMDLYEPHIKDKLHGLFDYLKIDKLDFFSWLDSFEMTFKHKITEEFLQTRIPEVMKSRNMALNPCSISEKEIEDIYRRL